MSRGRKPKPASLRLIEGNAGKRPIQKPPAPPPALPVAPDHLSADALAEWNRVVPGLEAMGLLSMVDAAALAAYCSCYARWQKAERKIAEFGAELVRTPNGSLQQSPWVSISNRSLDLMHKFLSEFGMTPVSRQRLAAQKGGDEDENVEKKFFS